MEAKAIARHVRVTPRKARRMVDLIRGKRASEAITILKFAPQDASLPVRKVLESAIANARVKAEKAGEPFREQDLVIKETYVDEGVTLKRYTLIHIGFLDDQVLLTEWFTGLFSLNASVSDRAFENLAHRQ